MKYKNRAFWGISLAIIVIGAQATQTMFQNEQVKIEVFDSGMTPSDPVAYTLQGTPVLSEYFIKHGIRVMRLNVTNRSQEPIMLNARSVLFPKISLKKAMLLLQRANTITPWPYAQSWAVYVLWAVVFRLFNLDLPGMLSGFNIGYSITIPRAPSIVQDIGYGVYDIVKGIVPQAAKQIPDSLKRYCGSLWNRTVAIPVLSLPAFFASSIYLAKINHKNAQIDEVCKSLGAGNIRLIYPVLIQPGQTIQKLVLLNMHAKDCPSAVGLQVFAANNQDIIASFEYQLYQVASAQG